MNRFNHTKEDVAQAFLQRDKLDSLREEIIALEDSIELAQRKLGPLNELVEQVEKVTEVIDGEPISHGDFMGNFIESLDPNNDRNAHWHERADHKGWILSIQEYDFYSSGVYTHRWPSPLMCGNYWISESQCKEAAIQWVIHKIPPNEHGTGDPITLPEHRRA